MYDKNLTFEEYQATRSLVSQDIKKIEEILSYSSCNEFTMGIHKIKQIFFDNHIVLNFYYNPKTEIILEIKIFGNNIYDVDKNKLKEYLKIFELFQALNTKT
ncbi:hypothetical protein [Aliarcobacter lanthieri]|uniref:hypothetical protein n=1 Tax=Aliarcobacter lanthieri TaxID=1355374 RepID=UPI00047AC9EC|nr:hypothetical protein [Aliarcobacter lanthieri]QKF59230.1 hypothetical protein ALANTH_1121 [Aliarcobacter lanthieri]